MIMMEMGGGIGTGMEIVLILIANDYDIIIEFFIFLGFCQGT